MSILTAIVLGLIQGLSEFIPISSTAHLTLAGRAFGLINPASPEEWTAFIAVIQLGTLVAVLLYFRRDLVSITRAFVGENLKRVPVASQSVESRTGWYIIAGTLPIVVIGLALKGWIEGMFTKNLVVIGSSLVGLALILWLAERAAKFTRSIEGVRLKDAIIIGLAQALAIVPGVSRSGSTITAGLFRGFTREAAARFSFLLSIPAVGASGILELVHALKQHMSFGVAPLVVATVVSAISGYAAIAFLLRYLRTHSTGLFISYRIILGGGILLAIALGRLAP
ncbi:MAG TPA: undecaprenyl-diphosphatase UppP [Candidatus Kapabacteria bacterium]|nr:undecaprenyl-diphosphatase UppP [Candidatus Kapabacteria bacterium]